MLALIGCFFIHSVAVKSQSIIYNENFDTSSSSLPSGWTTTSGGWEVSASNTSSVYIGGSGVNSIKIDNNNAATGTYSLTTQSVSTTGYSNITVSWLARLTTNFPSSSINPFLYYSIDNGLTWSGGAYTENSSASTWSLNTVTLPASINNKTSVMFQLVASIISASSGTYRIDDFKVTGTATSTSIDESSDKNSLKAYAFNKTVYIQSTIPDNSDFNVTIYSSEGKEIINEHIVKNADQIDLSAFSTGIYFIKIKSSGNQLFSGKVMID